MKKIGKGAVQQLPTAVPALSVQQSIVSRMESSASEPQGLENGLELILTALTELKQSLLQKAFSGELSSKSVEDATEAAA